jgi:hypothetical protein
MSARCDARGIVFAPHADERHVDVEPAERNLVHVPLDLCRCAGDALFELCVVDGVTARATVLVLLIRELQHYV